MANGCERSNGSNLNQYQKIQYLVANEMQLAVKAEEAES